MIYTTEQIHAALLENSERTEKVNEVKEDINNGLYTILDTCKLATAFNMFPATYGRLVENVVKHRFELPKPPNESYGDAAISKRIGIEIKTSFTRENGTLGLRQIRFQKNIYFFLLVNFDNYNKPISEAAVHLLDMEIEEINMGRLQFYLVPRVVMQYLVQKFGGYTHGTNSNLGKIVEDDLQSEGHEYSLNYNAYRNASGTSNLVWQQLQKYTCSEIELDIMIQNMKDKELALIG